MELSSAMIKDAEAPNIENEMEDCEEYTTTFSFYVISGSDLSYSPHGGREFFEATLMHPS